MTFKVGSWSPPPQSVLSPNNSSLSWPTNPKPPHDKMFHEREWMWKSGTTARQWKSTSRLVDEEINIAGISLHMQSHESVLKYRLAEIDVAIKSVFIPDVSLVNRITQGVVRPPVLRLQTPEPHTQTNTRLTCQRRGPPALSRITLHTHACIAHTHVCMHAKWDRVSCVLPPSWAGPCVRSTVRPHTPLLNKQHYF